MALVENRFVCDLSKPVQAQALKGNVFSLDNLGSRLSVLIYDNGQPATISGSITGNCILPDGSTVNISGGLTTENGGSKAYVDVPQSCLLIPGILKIAIKCTSSSVITTLAAIVANVYMTKTDNVITPSQQLIADWNAEISAAIATQNASIASQDTKIDDLESAFNSSLNGQSDAEFSITASGRWFDFNYVFIKGLKYGLTCTATFQFMIIDEAGNDHDYANNLPANTEYVFTASSNAVKIKAGSSAASTLIVKQKETIINDIKEIKEDIADHETEIETIKSQRRSRFNGKKISIIGDSIDTYNQAGYKIDGYLMYYPAHGVDNVNKTWWKQVIDNSGAVLEVNASWAGSRVTDTDPDPSYPDFYDRVNVIGTPDVIFVTLGTNDSSSGVALGEYDFDTAYTSLSESTFRTAYIKGIKALKATYPNADIICIAETMGDDYKNSILYIANTLSCEFIDAGDYKKESGSHPGVKGMLQIASLVLFPTDSSLTQKHMPADAKETNDRIVYGENRINNITEGLNGAINGRENKTLVVAAGSRWFDYDYCFLKGIKYGLTCTSGFKFMLFDADGNDFDYNNNLPANTEFELMPSNDAVKIRAASDSASSLVISQKTNIIDLIQEQQESNEIFGSALAVVKLNGVEFTPSKMINYKTGAFVTVSLAASLATENYVQIPDGKKRYLKYTRSMLTSSSTDEGMAFYDSQMNRIGGQSFGTSASVAHAEETTIEIPDSAKYVRFSFISSNGDFSAKVFTDNSVNKLLSDVEKLIEEAYPDAVGVVKPEDFEGDTIAEKVIAANEFINKSGGGFVFYFGDSSEYLITEAVTIPSNTIMIVDNCTIKLSNSIHDNIIRTSNIIPNPLQYNEIATCTAKVENIKIIGYGNAILCGPDVRYVGPTKEDPQTDVEWVGDAFGWRGHGLLFTGVDNFEVSGIKFQNIICFCSCYLGCGYGKINDISCNSDNKNNDIIEINTGSHDIEIKNVSGYSRDDAVAICCFDEGREHSQSVTQPIYPLIPLDYDDYTFGQNIHDVKIRHIKTDGYTGHQLILLTGGNQVYNVSAAGISDAAGHGRYGVVRVYGAWMNTYVDGNIHNICINDVECSHAWTNVISILGVPHDSQMNKIVVNNDVTPVVVGSGLPSFEEAHFSITNIIENE